MSYRCVATTVAGFVQQLAVSYVTNGYWFYVTGKVPDLKDPASVDRKIVAQYGIDVSKWTRTRQKTAGQARVQYLRYGRFFVILATHGEHLFFVGEGNQIRDIRRQPLHFQGYAISCRRGKNGDTWHPSVRIKRELFLDLKAYLRTIATRCSVEELCGELWRIGFEPYAPVRDQLYGLLRAINQQRKAAGLELVPPTALRLRRIPVRPFD
jgi:hypothetical protein